MEIYFPRLPIFQKVIEGSKPLEFKVLPSPDGLVHQITSPNGELMSLYPHSHITVINRNVGLPNTVVVIKDRDILAGIAGAEGPEFIFNPETGALEIIGGGIIHCGRIIDGHTKDGTYWISQKDAFQQLGERIVRFKKDDVHWQFSLVIGTKEKAEIEIIDPQGVNNLLNDFKIGIKDLIALLFDPQTPPRLKELILTVVRVESKNTIPVIMLTRLPNPGDLDFRRIFEPSYNLKTRESVLLFVPQTREATPEEKNQIEALYKQNSQS